MEGKTPKQKAVKFKDRETVVFRVSDDNGSSFIKEAGRILRRGGLVAFPTETVYGLGADAFNASAINRIFLVKGRPLDNPLIIHLSHIEHLGILAGRPSLEAMALAERFWPGPLTLVLNRKDGVPSLVSAGLPTVAVRIPAHPVALDFLKEAGTPVAAPSANLSGSPSPTDAGHVREDLAGKIEAILDGGSCRVGIESTVLDLSGVEPVILRPGGITREELENCLSRPVGLAEYHGEGAPRSPGMKYRHYAPRAPMYLYAGSPLPVKERMKDACIQAIQHGKKVGVMCDVESCDSFPGAEVQNLGARNDPCEAAASLYRALRNLDRLGVDIILAAGYNENAMGLALMNRLRKAAYTVIEVK